MHLQRWGDAPVHSIGAALFARKDQLHFFNDIGYRHEPFQHCPQGDLHSKSRCWCDPGQNFGRSFHSEVISKRKVDPLPSKIMSGIHVWPNMTTCSGNCKSSCIHIHVFVARSALPRVLFTIKAGSSTPFGRNFMDQLRKWGSQIQSYATSGECSEW